MPSKFIKFQFPRYGSAREDIIKYIQMPYYKGYPFLYYIYIFVFISYRVELDSAERCVERCIEDMQYCFLAQFTKDENDVRYFIKREKTPNH